ncbi:MAG TPA: MlaD family protein [Thermoleophilaceae bacterium]|nr:MlaD family protein [Thermoleophilaceae bacterium]
MGLTRVAALAAVIGGIALVALLLFGGGGGYTVKLRFLNAAQLVKGNVVDIGGTDAGLVKGFEITPDGQAEVEIEVDEKYAPLREGTRAQIRAAGQTSVAGRYIQLMLPPENQAGEDIQDGGVIDTSHTTTNVDIDQFFSIFDPKTRRSIQNFYEGGRRQYEGRGEQANRGLMYLNPQLAASSRLFEELRHEPAALERFLVGSERLVTALSERRDDLASLIGNLNSTTRALGSEKEALAEAIGRLPPFMRQANTTYVNLRSTLDELDPWVEASKPVARKLRPYLAELRPFAQDAVPTVRRLRLIARRPGRPNDLLELQRAYPPLEQITLVEKNRSIDFGTGRVNVGRTLGAFPQMSRAFEDSAPIVAHGRPYTVDFLGWMDDFSHTGTYDALGSFSRAQLYVNAFSMQGGLPTGELIPLADRGEVFKELARTKQVARCPGASEEPAPDGSNVWSEEEQKELDCQEAHRATGEIK